MPNTEKTLRNAETATDPSLNFSYNELLAELVAEEIPAVNPGLDVTKEMYANALGISIDAAYSRLERKVRVGELARHVARNSVGKRVIAYRRP